MQQKEIMLEQVIYNLKEIGCLFTLDTAINTLVHIVTNSNLTMKEPISLQLKMFTKIYTLPK
jgi:hypothetical protein